MNILMARYNEIRFTRLVQHFYKLGKLDKLTVFLEAMCDISNASQLTINHAMQKIIMNDPLCAILKPEHIICLYEAGVSKHKIRKMLECSPNTILQYLDDYRLGNIYIYPRFDEYTTQQITLLIEGMDKAYSYS